MRVSRNIYWIAPLLLCGCCGVFGVGSFLRDERLLAASWEGDLAKVRNLVRFGADVNFQEDTGKTPIWGAAVNGHVEVVEFLISCGADILRKNDKGQTVLDDHIDPNMRSLLTRAIQQRK
ncbi:MAG: ankyrin repeat domain-containing protein [Fimbriimonadaceae bacterium]